LAAHGFSFEYPSSWEVIANEVIAGVDLTWVVGTGSWEDGCESTGSMTTCSGPVMDAGADEVVMEFSLQFSGPYTPIFDPPPFETTVLPSGAVAVLPVSGAIGGATIYAPGREALRIRTAVGQNSPDSVQTDVRRVINSLTYDPATVVAGDLTWDPSSALGGECERRTIEGRLNNGHSPDLMLLQADYHFTQLIWPVGWTVRANGDGRGEVVDDSGVVLARQWDQVEVGGRGEDDEFKVCPGAVTVIRSYPSQ